MPNDAFVPGGNVINREIKRFEAHSNAYYFPIRAEHFDGLFQCDIGTGAFNHQPQIVFATNLLAACHHIFGRTIYYCRRTQFFCNREADRYIFLQTNDDDIYRPHNPRHLYGEQPEWASADDDHILTWKEFRLLRDGFIGITDRVKYGCVLIINTIRDFPQRMTMNFENFTRNKTIFGKTTAPGIVIQNKVIFCVVQKK